MSISLMPLPYGADALAPAISADTLEVHHGKHHKAYVDKTNDAISGTPLADAPLEQIVATARRSDPKLFNNAAQAWNHGLYWASLTPAKSSPEGELLAAIKRDFGSVDALVEALSTHGADHFASGWVWLAASDGKLSVVETHDADTLANSAPQKNPLFLNMTTGDSWRGWMGLHFAHATLKQGHPVAIFLNLDPRGYALKIDDQDARALDIYKDWGGYGIICPEFDGRD